MAQGTLAPGERAEPHVSPVPSLASFRTAITSQDAPELEPEPPVSPRTGPSLRKSISVDSFHPSPENSPKSAAFPQPAPPVRRRSRGSSVSATPYRTSQDSTFIDSDLDRSDSADRFRRVSARTADLKHPVRAGNLPLPSRIQSASSLQTAVPKPSLARLSSRSRSGSLGQLGSATSNHGTTIQSRRMVINTNLDLRNLSMSILVVGTPGCGKTVTIHKGCRHYGLRESVPYQPPVPIPGTSLSTPYLLRVGQVPGEAESRYTVKVIEAQAPASSEGVIESMPEVWPRELPRIDGVLVCYDVSSPESFQPVESLIRGYKLLKLPTTVLSCKMDLEQKVDRDAAYKSLKSYHSGLIEVSQADEAGKARMRLAFDWSLKAVLRDRRAPEVRGSSDYLNPASPDVLKSPFPWSDSSQTVTPTAASSVSSINLQSTSVASRRTSQVLPTIHSPPATGMMPESSTRTSGDIPETEESKIIVQQGESGQKGITSLPNNSSHSIHDQSLIADETIPEAEAADDAAAKFAREKETRPAHWATLDELLDKLLFLAISGDDPAFVTHFLLTYRRFAIPRSILLAMQKRMRQLDNPSGDPMFACYAQMKICHLLETWMRDYPHDFAARGSAGALTALVKSVISKTYLLHYGSDFLHFLELLPDSVDYDASWALKIPEADEESDDSDSNTDEEDHEPAADGIQPTFSSNNPPKPLEKDKPTTSTSRERKQSLPLSRTGFIGGGDSAEFALKTQLKELNRISAEIQNIDSGEIAQEITRIEVEAFLQIEPRHWLKYAFTSGKRDPSNDKLVAFNEVSNRLGDWVVSLILCHDRPKARARQVEKLIEIAQKLRALSNYSALRAVVAGINAATLDDQSQNLQARSTEQAKNLRSWGVLLHPARSHRAYRLALRNTKGPCIPALEVHMADLIKAHEGNADINELDPTQIHWGKFNLMGRFISTTTVCQAQCRATSDYSFPKREKIKALINTPYLMNDETQNSRVSQLDNELDDMPANPARDASGQQALFKRLFKGAT